MSPLEIIFLVAISFVWSRGSIFRPVRTRGPRAWVAFADCPLCTGFWIGLVGHILWASISLRNVAAHWNDWREVITLLGIGSLVGMLTLAICATIRRL